MKKLFIKKLEDMPAWFSNDNYAIFDDFSLEDLYKEIQLKEDSYNNDKKKKED